MSLHVLAIDTTGDVGSIALVGERGLIEEVVLDSADGFAHVLFDEIERLLERQGLNVSQMDAFIGIGPRLFHRGTRWPDSSEGLGGSVRA